MAKTIGAIHVYRENEKFEEHDFDFVMSASSILGTALLRAQHQVALQTPTIAWWLRTPISIISSETAVP